MRGVLTATITELLKFQTAGDRLLVLRCRIVLLFAIRALHCDVFPHFNNPSSAFSFQLSAFSFGTVPELKAES